MRKQIWKIGILSALVVFLVSGCAREDSTASSAIVQGQSDLAYVQEKGTLTVGITDFAPMDYRDGEDWTGFDADLAEAFAAYLDVSLEFVEIDWDKKTELLEKGDIDCIWNGMTMTDELKETISCSDSYLSNAQVVVLRGGELGEYPTVESCQHLLFAVEAGSVGESILKEKKYRYTAFSTQKEALQSVSEKKADATVIDVIMAAYYTDDEQEYSDLGFEIALNDETICIGFRKDSDLTGEANAFLQASYEDGSIRSLAEKYGIENALLQ